MQTTNDERVLSVHLGQSANCSSIGSVIDVLFVSGVAGTALLAAFAVLLRDKKKEGDEQKPAPEQPSTSDDPRE